MCSIIYFRLNFISIFMIGHKSDAANYVLSRLFLCFASCVEKIHQNNILMKCRLCLIKNWCCHVNNSLQGTFLDWMEEALNLINYWQTILNYTTNIQSIKIEYSELIKYMNLNTAPDGHWGLMKVMNKRYTIKLNKYCYVSTSIYILSEPKKPVGVIITPVLGPDVQNFLLLP